MPIYFDEDYNHKVNISRQSKNDFTLSLKKKEDRSVMTAGFIDKACILYNSLRNFQGASVIRQEKVQELFKFLCQVLSNPKLLLNANLRNNNRAKKMSSIFNMIRCFPVIDSSVKMCGLNSVQAFVKFEGLQYERSHEYIQCFRNSTSTDKFLCAVIIGRKVMMYDYLS